MHRLTPTAGNLSFPISIFIAGDILDAKRILKKYCHEHGCCVTVTPTEYIYTGGAETGVIVGLINYPRFPSTPEELTTKAVDLAQLLLNGLFQKSVTVQTPAQTLWFSQREEEK
jgi:hypothetical protein